MVDVVSNGTFDFSSAGFVLTQPRSFRVDFSTALSIIDYRYVVVVISRPQPLKSGRLPHLGT